MRGSVAGALWGLVLGGAGLGAASLVDDHAAAGDRPAMPEVTQLQSATAEPAPENLVATPVDPAPELTAEAPRAEPPAPRVDAPIPAADPVTAPEASAAEPALDTPVQMAPPPVTTTVETPPAPAAPALPQAAEPAPAQAQVEVVSDAPPVTTEQATPTVALTEPEEPTAPAPDMPEAPTAQDPEPAPMAAAPAPVTAPQEDQPADVITTAAPATEVSTPDVAAAEAPAKDIAVMVPPAAPASVAPVTVTPQEPSVPEVETPAVVIEAPAAPILPAADPIQPLSPAQQDAPAKTVTEPEQTPTSLPRVNTGVRVNRPGAEPAPTAGTPAEVIADEELPEDAPALQRFAAAFENPQGWPMVSVVLLDDGTMANTATALSSLSFPVTVILDPLQSDVNAKMAAYRAAGIEVGLQVALPFGAQAQDVEVAFEAAFEMVPEAVLLFSGGDDLLQTDRAVTEQVIAVLAAEGLGLIAVERGLGNVLRIATQAEVPAAPVERRLEDEATDAMGRAMDQAAFRARQGTGVVLLGQLTPGLLDGLSDWARDAALKQIAIAPASAVLLQP